MLFLLAAVSILDRNIVTLLVDPIKRHFELSDTQMGLVVGAAFALPFGLFIIPIGWAVDRFPRRAIVAASVATWSSATAATGLAGSFGTLVAARSLTGISEASLGPASASWLGDLFPREKLALPMAFTNLGYQFGQGLALMLGGFLALQFVPHMTYPAPWGGDLKGWQFIFIIVGLPGLIFVPLVFLAREPARDIAGDHDQRAADIRSFMAFIIQNRRFILLHHLGFLALIAVSAVMLTWTPTFFMRVHHWTEDVVGRNLGIAMLIAPLISLPLHGALADMLYRRGWKDIHLRYPLYATLAGTPLIAAIFTVPSPELAVFLVAVFWFIVSSYTSLPLTALVSVTPSRLRGKAISLVGLVSGTTGLISGPLIVGMLTDTVFRDPALVGYSIMCATAALILVFAGSFSLALHPLREMNLRAPA